MTSDQRVALRAAIDQSLAAWRDHAPMPTRSAQEREVAAEIIHQWCGWHLDAMRARAGLALRGY